MGARLAHRQAAKHHRNALFIHHSSWSYWAARSAQSCIRVSCSDLWMRFVGFHSSVLGAGLLSSGCELSPTTCCRLAPRAVASVSRAEGRGRHTSQTRTALWLSITWATLMTWDCLQYLTATGPRARTHRYVLRLINRSITRPPCQFDTSCNHQTPFTALIQTILLSLLLLLLLLLRFAELLPHQSAGHLRAEPSFRQGPVQCSD